MNALARQGFCPPLAIPRLLYFDRESSLVGGGGEEPTELVSVMVGVSGPFNVCFYFFCKPFGCRLR